MPSEIRWRHITLVDWISKYSTVSHKYSFGFNLLHLYVVLVIMYRSRWTSNLLCYRSMVIHMWEGDLWGEWEVLSNLPDGRRSISDHFSRDDCYDYWNSLREETKDGRPLLRLPSACTHARQHNCHLFSRSGSARGHPRDISNRCEF